MAQDNGTAVQTLVTDSQFEFQTLRDCVSLLRNCQRLRCEPDAHLALRQLEIRLLHLLSHHPLTHSEFSDLVARQSYLRRLLNGPTPNQGTN
jgi:hypothetical protein